MTVIEKIMAAHSGRETLEPGDIVDLMIDARVARDFGGANVVQHMVRYQLEVSDPSRTFFTFDCNPTGSDQKYATNQQICRQYARAHGIRVYDINKGIGSHILIEEGLAYPGSTAISTDSHANILGAVGAFGQGMGDKDTAGAWQKGTVWFRVPSSVKIVMKGKPDPALSAKDIVLNLLALFGADSLLGVAIEVEGEMVDGLTLDQRITIASMATELGAIIMLFPPNQEVIRYCQSRAMKIITPVTADPDASYADIREVDVTRFTRRISLPGKPHDTAEIPEEKIWIDSAFIGSCTNGRIEDMKAAADVLRGRKIAECVVLKIVPATDRVWQQCMDEGLLEVFKESGALVSNAGCAGCAAGQVGQNGPGEVTVSTGNRNFPGKQGKGAVYLASPEVAAASAIAGYITDPDRIPEQPAQRPAPKPEKRDGKSMPPKKTAENPVEVTGRVWYIPRDHIDTDMIYHNSYLSVTDVEEMGQYTFRNMEGYENFASEAAKGDILVAGKNFGSGSSRQQAVDCFQSLGIQCVIAESFGSIYERNAINAAFPILVSDRIGELQLTDGDKLTVNFRSGLIHNRTKDIKIKATPFSEIQLEIYQHNGLF
ncbi:MAG TPA: 3-isopropylmalate dehydratase large subunit [Bacteroides sp.]|nr:3-isopropylmalate dehydratase large subunit [Bacteroides sp.]